MDFISKFKNYKSIKTKNMKNLNPADAPDIVSMEEYKQVVNTNEKI